jgi:gas vesicle protein
MGADLEQEVERAVEQAEMTARRGSAGSFFLGILIGAVVGGGVALLFAPKTGKEAREILGDKATQAKDKLQEGVGKVKERVGRMRQNMPSSTE